jgi:hypothetical protein
MKVKLLVFLLFVAIQGIGQDFIEPANLPLIPYKPSVLGANFKNEITIAEVFNRGIKVVVADKTFKVIQFDVVYACHSGSLLDFDVKRYHGDKVEGTDVYLRKRILAGDAMDIVNTIIEKKGVRYRMNDFSFLVIR